MLTSHEILKQCGLRSGKTLRRYVDRALIPPGTVQGHPGGRGRIAYWPTWVVGRIHQIQERLAKGQSLSQIRNELGTDWQSEERLWSRRRPDFRRAAARLDRDRAIDQAAELGTDAIYAYLRQLGVERPGVGARLERELSESKLVDRVLYFLRRGASPLIVFLGEKIEVTTDFLLPSVLAQPELRDKPMLVLPVRELFLAAFAEAEPKLGQQVKYAPAAVVVERDDGATRERRFRRKGQWNFAIDRE